MSILSEAVASLLKETYPEYKIYPEYFVPYKGYSLFFDFYVRDLRLLIECQGEQHYKHIKFFHKTEAEFKNAQHRDTLKQTYAKENSLLLLYIDKDNLPTERLDFLKLIHRRLHGD
jgi:very-short-patch-repair endonuclease